MTEEANVTNEVEAVADTENVTLSKTEYAALMADREEKETLKAHHEKVAEEKKQSVAKAKAEADKAAKDKAEAEGNYKELLALKEKEFNDKVTEYENKLTSYEQQQTTNKINNAANAIATQLTKHAGKASDLTEKLAKRIKMTDDGLVVIDDKGKIVSDKIETLAEFSKKNYDYLCDGLQSTGTAGIKAVIPTGTNNHDNIDPIARLNRARGIK